jgi:uncharacterized protein YodC (DUF2158 family)
MTTERGAQLSPEELEIKIATRAASKAAGGQEYLSASLGTVQSRWSEWGSSHTRAFLPAHLVAEVEDRSAGAPGWPHITRALARRQGFELFRLPSPEALRTVWGQHLAGVAKEGGEIMARLALALVDNDVSQAEAKDALPDARDLVRVAVELAAALEATATGQTPLPPKATE